MEVASHSAFFDALPTILTAIQEAQFVSLDLEFGGISNHQYAPGHLPSLEERYKHIREAAGRFPVLQFGITTVRWKPSTQRFELKPFNITLDLTAPNTLGFDRIFSFSSDTVRFLQSSGFQFEAGFGSGVGYLSHHEQKLALESPVRPIVHDIPVPANEEESNDVEEFCEYINEKLDLLDLPEVSSVAIYPFGSDTLGSNLDHSRHPVPLFSMYQKSLIRKCVEEREKGWIVIMNQDLVYVRKDPNYEQSHSGSGGRPGHAPRKSHSYDQEKWQVDRKLRILREREELIPSQIGLRWVFDFMAGKVSASEIRDALVPDNGTDQDLGKRGRGRHYYPSPSDKSFHEENPYSALLASVEMIKARMSQDSPADVQDAMDLMVSHIRAKRKEASKAEKPISSVPGTVAGQNGTHQTRNGSPTTALQARWNAIPSPDRKRKSVLVGHNNFVDLVYLYKTFVGPLPETLDKFAREIHDFFPVIVDTKYFRVKNARILDANLPLEHLVSPADAHLEPVAEIPAGFTDYAAPKEGHSQRQHQHHRRQGSQQHQAGYDSWLTALYLVRLYASRVWSGDISGKDLVSSTNVSRDSLFKQRGALPKELLYSMLFDFGLGYPAMGMSTGTSSNHNHNRNTSNSGSTVGTGTSTTGASTTEKPALARNVVRVPPLWKEDINHFCALGSKDRIWDLNEGLRGAITDG